MNDNQQSQNQTALVSTRPSFAARVIANDATKKGAAAAVAGLVVAIVAEVLWPAE